jgi:hypothetical protein
MKTLVIYDNGGYIISITETTETPRFPSGVPYLYEEIPQGKQIKKINGVGVDTTVTPHELMLEDIPPSEIDMLKAENASVQETLDLILTEIIPSLIV